MFSLFRKKVTESLTYVIIAQNHQIYQYLRFKNEGSSDQFREITDELFLGFLLSLKET